MTRPEATSKKPPLKPADLDCFSIAEFCRRHGVSVQTYYKLRGEGLMPDEIRLGTRVLISRESAARWRAAREAATAADPFGGVPARWRKPAAEPPKRRGRPRKTATAAGAAPIG
jgi:hypothetical protein